MRKDESIEKTCHNTHICPPMRVVPLTALFVTKGQSPPMINPIDIAEVEETILKWLSTLSTMNLDTIEIAFFGWQFYRYSFKKAVRIS